MGDGVRRLIWTLAGSDLVLAPDTGPVHIARALDVPVIGLYGHTNPWRVGPYREFQELWVDAYTDPGEAPDPSRFDARLRAHGTDLRPRRPGARGGGARAPPARPRRARRWRIA